MKRALFILVIFITTLQIGFAQGGRVVTVYFHNGSIIKGEISKLPNEERFRIKTPNGSIVLFTSSEVKDVLYEDGTRPGANASTQRYAQQQPQPRQPQPQYQTVSPRVSQLMHQPTQPAQPAQPQAPAGKEAAQQSQSHPDNRQTPPAEVQSRWQSEEEAASEEEYGEFDDEEYIDEESDDVPVDDKKAVSDKAPAPAPAPSQSAVAMGFMPGYHGYIDFGHTMGMGDSIHAFNRMELSITQGYQFTPSLFAGLGAGVHLYSDSVPLNRIDADGIVSHPTFSYIFPVFVDLRYSLNLPKMQRVKPFAALKAGYGIGLVRTFSTSKNEANEEISKTLYEAQPLGFYVAPAIGVKYMITRSIAINAGVGYSMQFYDDESIKTVEPGGEPDPTPTTEAGGTVIKKMDFLGGLTMKVGLEF
jgi:hypothetical protein